MALVASDIMTRNVVTTTPDASVRDIAATLSEHEISAVPVCDEHGHVVGIVSEGDLMKPFGSANMMRRAWWLDLLAEGDELAPEFLNYVKMDHRLARDLMSSPVLTKSENTPVSELADVMTANRVKRLPILRAGKLVGVVSRSDIVRTLADVVREAALVS
ncbi:CBS domain-containing protein [Acidisoma sp.]|uniref:CBS domain-containing protein n=1 Tax=Acidisoma sp. TaxID=1872115 RepID=UPI003AFFE2FD